VSRSRLARLTEAPTEGVQERPSESTPVSFRLGTGLDIYAGALLPAMLAAQQELILVTCFWHKSQTLAALNRTLLELTRRRRLNPARRRLRIRICLSSTGPLQMLSHAWRRGSYTYPPSAWSSKLGLPSPDALAMADIDLVVKSLFSLPFSVMHPKYVIVDRSRAFIPSCNVSSEAWLEGCVEITGPAIGRLLDFYGRIWDAGLPPERIDTGAEPPLAAAPDASSATGNFHRVSSAVTLVTLDYPTPVPTVVLPSPHHRNPRIRPFPWQSSAPPPATPLNVASLEILRLATRSIYVQTPNLTCSAVLNALLDALRRGVDVRIVTNPNLMVLQQLLTAWTTTSRCLKWLIRRYQAIRQTAVTASRGKLHISHFKRLDGTRVGRRPDDDVESAIGEEPVQSHVKFTVVDNAFTLLGSGNMDRASWYTSQELGILFQSADFASRATAAMEGVLEGRLEVRYDSDAA